MSDVLVVTGTGTEVGKTIVTAAVAAVATAAGRRVAVLKAAQTGLADDEDGDAAVVRRLAGLPVDAIAETARYPEPLAPATAARRAGRPPVRPPDVAAIARRLAETHDLVLVEGAGGLLVHLADDGSTLADVAGLLEAPVLVVAPAALGTLNATALTTEALRARGLACAGVVVGAWPDRPDLAARCNVADLPAYAQAPLVGVLPSGAGSLDPPTFRAAAPGWVDASLGGRWRRADSAPSSAPQPTGPPHLPTGAP